MLDDSLFGRRGPRGDRAPAAAITYPEVFVWPPRPAAILRWLFG